MKRISAFLLAAVVMFTLAGCGGASSQAGTGQPQSAADSAAESSGEVQAESRETDEQVPETESQETGAAESEKEASSGSDMLVVYFSRTGEQYNVGVIDKGNTAIVAEMIGEKTGADLWEVLPDGSGLRSCYRENTEIEGPDDWPEIVRDSLPCYYDAAADRYYYVCEGVTHDGYAHQYYAWYALCLKNGVAEWEPIAYKNDNWDANGNCTTDCHDAQGNDITQADYESAAKRRFAGLQELTLSLSWTQEEIEWGYSADSSWMDEPAESADSTVEDFSAAYSSVIEKYRAAYDSGNTENLEYIWNNGISEIIGYSSGVGYALEDLDQNGIPELIIAGMGTDDFSNRMVYDLYTLENNVPVNIVTSQARSRYYIRTDNTVLFEGSGGASYSYFTVKRLNGNMLEDMESVFTNLDQDAYDTYSTGFYYQQGYSETLPSDSSIKITEEDFGKRVWEMESSVYVPTLTQIF